LPKNQLEIILFRSGIFKDKLYKNNQGVKFISCGENHNFNPIRQGEFDLTTIKTLSFILA
jgi:hypothetical protein